MGVESIETRGCIRTVTLGARADGKLSTAGIAALTEALTRLPTPAERAVVILSSRVDFCLGRAQDEVSPAAPPTSLTIRDKIAAPILSLYRAISASSLPVIAAVNGRAIGMGCAIAGAADVTLASENACFSLPELRQGVPPTLAISALLGRVPHKALMDMVLSRRDIDAKEALRIGIISRISANPKDDANALASSLADVPLRALATTKSYFALTADAASSNARVLAGEMIGSAVAERS